MPTLKEVRRKMLELNPGFGELSVITALSTTSVTVGAKSAPVNSAVHVNKYLLRAEAASAADRLRMCSGFASGVFSHAGTNYADTTATDEYLEIHEYDPTHLDRAIQVTLGRLRRNDRETFPTVSGLRHYPLDACPWIDQPARELKWSLRDSPVISRDRYVQKWNTVNSAGALTPDWWTLSATTPVRSATQHWRQATSTKITRAGSDLTMSQTVGLLLNGAAAANGEDLRGVNITVCATVWSEAASQVRVRISDGLTTTNSAYHTGDSTWRELSAAMDVSTSATTLTITVSVETSNMACYVGDVFACETSRFGDAVRRDAYLDRTLDALDTDDYEQGPPITFVIREPIGRGRQLVLNSSRPFPRFDDARIAAGTADADSTDAPLVPLATGAIAETYRALSMHEGVDGGAFAAKHLYWRAQFEQLAARYLYAPSNPRGGANLPAAAFLAPAPRGVR